MGAARGAVDRHWGLRTRPAIPIPARCCVPGGVSGNLSCSSPTHAFRQQGRVAGRQSLPDDYRRDGSVAGYRPPGAVARRAAADDRDALMAHAVSGEPVAAVGGWRLEHTYAELPALFHAAAADAGPRPAVRGVQPRAGGGARAGRGGPRLAGGCRDLRRQRPARRARSRWPRPTPASVRSLHHPRRRPRDPAGRADHAGGQRVDIQLKGAGQTPLLATRRRPRGPRADAARVHHQRGDARAGHSHHAQPRRGRHRRAGVSRAALPGAVLTRIAASHIRVGTFEWAAAQRDPDGAARARRLHAEPPLPGAGGRADAAPGALRSGGRAPGGAASHGGSSSASSTA